MEDNLKIGARDLNNLKFKLAMKGIQLKEKGSDENIKETFQNDVGGNGKSIENKDYVESIEDVNFGKITYVDLKGGVVTRWGPDNSKRARKLREELIK